MKIVLVHDQLNQFGGAEQTVKAIADLYNDAPLFTIVKDKDQFLDSMFQKTHITQSWMGKWRIGKKLFRWFLLLIPSAVESLNIPKDTDIIISSSSHFAKGVIPPTGSVHICYCHTPTRYLWSDTHEYIHSLPYNKIVKFFILLSLPILRIWDYVAAQRVDYYIANSHFIADRIRTYYKREAKVIYPPVDIERFTQYQSTHVVEKNPQEYFLIGGRLRPYKRFDIAIKAFNKLGIPLKIFGGGEDEEYLKSIAKDNIEFCGNVSQEDKMKLLNGCKGFLYPQIEDFGITMIEAMAFGKPVIAYNAGGASEIITTGTNGILFDEQTWEDMADSILHFDEYKFDPLHIKTFASRFAITRFQKEIDQYVQQVYADRCMLKKQNK